MASFNSIALLRAHQPLPAFMNYLVSDLTELAGLGASVRDLVSDVAIPVSPVDRDPLASFQAYMARNRPELVGISVFTCGAKAAQSYVEIAKMHGAYVVLGGYHPSALPNEVLSWPGVDAVVRGEGERTLRDLVLNGPSKNVLGLSFKDNGSVVHAAQRPLIEDLDSLPLPDRTLRPRRFGRRGDDYHVDTVYTSRGCRARCAFCANHLVGKRWRDRGHASVIRELESIRPGSKRRPKLVKLWDPNFMTDIPRTATLCQAIIDADLHRRFRFVAETRVDDILRGRDILELMARAGFERLGTGIESPNAETLRLVRKGGSGSAAQAAALVKAHRINLEKFYIIGLPEETEQTILGYADAATDAGAWKQNAHFFILTPYPGTATYNELARAGQIASRDWNLYNNYMATIEPGGIPQLRLQALHAAVTIRYSLVKRFQRGVPFREIVLKLLTLVVAFLKVVQQQRAFSRDQQIECIWSALEMVGELPERPSSGKARFLGSLQLRLHRRDYQPLIFGRLSGAGRERAACSPAEIPGGPAINLSMDDLYTLVERFDLRKSANDVLTMVLSPFSLGPRSIAGLAGLTLTLAAAGLKMARFHVSRVLEK